MVHQDAAQVFGDIRCQDSQNVRASTWKSSGLDVRQAGWFECHFTLIHSNILGVCTVCIVVCIGNDLIAFLSM
jgi:hypothetical protein